MCGSESCPAYLEGEQGITTDWNSRSEQRPIDGFVYAISPFNFTALAVNLVLAPIIVGNVVIWKPSPGAVLSNWLFNKIMIEAGLPAGVLQFLPGDAELVTETVLSSKEFSALHFTGSTQVFRNLWTKIGTNVGYWRSYPRLIGETSGKNFHLLHPSADVRNAALKTVRAVFEYQGQKCSACSRVYVPSSLAKEFLSILKTETSKLSMGSKITDFCGPVINEAAYERISKFLSDAKLDDEVDIIEGGECDDSVGYYIVSFVSHPVLFYACANTRQTAPYNSMHYQSALKIHDVRDIWPPRNRIHISGLGIWRFPF